jgi:hypothetical protein
MSSRASARRSRVLRKWSPIHWEVDVFTLARVVRMATGAVVALVVAGILVHVLEANTSNDIVSALNDTAKWLTQPFHNIFSPDGEKARIAVNWGLAAVVYAIVGGLLARLLARSALAGRMRRPWRRRSPA